LTKKDARRNRTDDEHNIQSDLLSDSESEKSPDKRKDLYGNGPPRKKKRANFTMIVKPDCMSQGKGIFLTHDLDQIPLNEPYVVQEYMQEPYLIDGLKFDLRLYVLVLSCEPLRIFLY